MQVFAPTKKKEIRVAETETTREMNQWATSIKYKCRSQPIRGGGGMAVFVTEI